MSMISFKILDCILHHEPVIQYEEDDSDNSSSNDEYSISNNNVFIIQLFGIDEIGETYCIFINEFRPFFYVKVDDNWTSSVAREFFKHIKTKMGIHKDGLIGYKFVKRKTLYGFDNNKEHAFVCLQFSYIKALQRVKSLYIRYSEKTKEKKILPYTEFRNTQTYIYESNIPPLLRFFHIQEISPSGWITIPKNKCHTLEEIITSCTYEYETKWNFVKPMEGKDEQVPYKICSFDIEASSSHGDFPLPVKTYKKLATNIVDYWIQDDIDKSDADNILENMILSAFGYIECHYVDKVYIKHPSAYNKDSIKDRIKKFLLCKEKMETLDILDDDLQQTLYFYSIDDDDEGDKATNYISKTKKEKLSNEYLTCIDILYNISLNYDKKIQYISTLLNKNFPAIEGDKVTFIGSTFLRYGENEPYKKHCIALNTCSDVSDCEIEEYKTEKEVLLAWSKLIREEDPDIIIGYNIFGFDYSFLFKRAQENNCESTFLEMSRNVDEICATFRNGKYNIHESSITIASGTHNLSFIKMNGRIQIDLYNLFRRDYNLESYKLDFVSGYFIGDSIYNIDEKDDYTVIYSKNLKGLKNEFYIHFEEIGHTTEYYNQGQKFKVSHVENNCFRIQEHIQLDPTKKHRWCLAKDDVTPQDMFRMTNEGPDERAIIAKYCIQDCNLVHYLMNKIDVITGFVEMSNLCFVPMDFLIMRGQGIKLLSYVAKQCREFQTLIPDIEKKNDGGYEGAIVLEPKCGVYLDDPVACVDYSSLYPSSMISENLSHDSKVWTKEYNLQGELVEEWGEKDKNGNYIYDNLDEFEYVDVTYDTYHYKRKHPKSAAIKTKVGYKTCRWAQFPNGKLGILPSILQQLLKARKDTRKSAKFKTITDINGKKYSGFLETSEHGSTITDKNKQSYFIPKDEIASIEDTYTPFMKNVLDKRQLAIKMTANSLYGQCGAKTSSFYEKDVAASTTATGRNLLLYGKKIIEEVYGDRVCNTKYGLVHSHAEYIYGDSVLGNTPIILKHKQTNEIHIKTIDEIGASIWKPYEEFKPFDTYESNRKYKQQQDIDFYDVWTKSGWSKIKRVIRHKCNKKIFRVLTHNSVIDVTEDHSLLNQYGEIIKPNNIDENTILLENEYKTSQWKLHHIVSIIPRHILSEISTKKGRQGYFTLCCNNKKIISALYIYLRSLSYNCYIDYIEDEKYKITYTTISLYEKSSKVKEFYVLHESYNDFVYDIETEDGTFNAGFPTIIKNTDSVFMTFNLTDLEGNKIGRDDALKYTIELAKEAGHLATSFLKAPHDLEYEKTFLPFVLLSKKRYVGMLYEEDIHKCYRKSMGIVLKRRDNAPIVKDIYGGVIDILLKDRNIPKAVEFTKSFVNDIADEKFPLEKLVISKSLRSYYKNPKQIAHKVLADRIGKRDPGNKPKTGDRIPFVYITNKKAKLQGERIETPEYIRENKIRPDYAFYITNQIMKPLQQVFALVLEHIPEFARNVRTFKNTLEIIHSEIEDDEKCKKKEQDIRNKEVKKILFEKTLKKIERIKNNQKDITSFFM